MVPYATSSQKDHWHKQVQSEMKMAASKDDSSTRSFLLILLFPLRGTGWEGLVKEYESLWEGQPTIDTALAD